VICIDDRAVIDLAPLEIQKEGGPLTERPAHRAAVLFQEEWRLFLRVGIPRVEDVIAEIEESLAVQLIRARFGEDLDAAITQLAELGRERVLIDAYFADRSLRRKLAAAEPVDINLAALGTGRRSGQRLQVRLQIVRVVRERLQIFSAQDQGRSIIGGLRGHAGPGIFLDGHLLRYRRHLHPHVERLSPGLQNNFHRLRLCEIRRVRAHRIAAGRYTGEGVRSIVARRSNCWLFRPVLPG
jgi:hypothetical protein